MGVPFEAIHTKTSLKQYNDIVFKGMKFLAKIAPKKYILNIDRRFCTLKVLIYPGTYVYTSVTWFDFYKDKDLNKWTNS
jgi:hypothetical protein